MLNKSLKFSFLLLVILFLPACQSPVVPTRMAMASTVDLSESGSSSSENSAQVPPTWTLPPQLNEETPIPNSTEPPPATSTPQPTITSLPSTNTSPPLVPTNTPVPLPTNTPVQIPTDTPIPIPTNTAVPIPTNTPIPIPTDTPEPIPPTDTPIPPTTAPPPVFGVNLLPNPSFEEGHYNSGGVGELQVPNGWIFVWDGGTNPFVDPPDNYFVRPETRVLPASHLPAHEHPLYIWDGQHTVKIFKGYWAINVQLLADVFLEPGTYIFEINVFPDLVVDYGGGQKVYPSDPYAGEVRFIVTGAGTNWFPPAFGQKNTFTHLFNVSQAQVIRVGVGLRNRYGIMNNGWFIDDWSLMRLENP